MKAQSGMLLLEVLLAMAIFASAVTALVTSMQWQLSALETLEQETLALWVADNQLIKKHTLLSATEKGESSQQGNAFTWEITGVPSAVLNRITVTSSRGKTVRLYAWSPTREQQEAKHD